MSTNYEPLQEARKGLQIPWYRCPIEKARLRELTTRSDFQGTLQTVGFIALLAVTGAATWLFFDRRIWVGFAVALFAHGTIYSFIPGLATHELAHGTVFKTRWVNDVLVRFLSLVSWFNFHDYKMSHTYHHLYTLHPRGDREVILPTNPNVNPFHILQLLTLNLVGGRGEPYSWPIARVIGATVKLAFTGKFEKEWLEAVYADQPEARRRSITWAWLLLVFHAVLLAVSIVLGLWPLPLLVTFASFIGNWWRYFVGLPMHTGLMDNTPDFRLCVRTITLDPFSAFLYWQMNWHTEHHMFAAVPCYNLRKLHKAVAFDMPEPRTLVGAWREMRETWKRQQQDPAYQFDTPLPKPREEKKERDSSEGSLGDLDPRKPE